MKNQFKIISNMLRNSIKSDINNHFCNYLLDINSNNDTFEAIRKLTKHKKKSRMLESVFTDVEKNICLTKSEEIGVFF